MGNGGKFRTGAWTGSGNPGEAGTVGGVKEPLVGTAGASKGDCDKCRLPGSGRDSGAGAWAGSEGPKMYGKSDTW